MSLESLKPKESINDLGQYLENITHQPGLGIYLRILAGIFSYSALIHITNLAGWGEKTWSEMPLSWKIGDIVYSFLDIAVVIGLWQKQVWGILLFWLAILSQFIIYTVFIDYFALTTAHRDTIHGLLATEAVLLFIFMILLVIKK